ncbi:hypothetical protein G3I21_11945 [Streptomyces bauhiniae]|uniref:Uncharacterized protein n=1 Tax=Streptomyces bauhiniae TaxID=2340725 RepID=A0A7K3QRL8_9ACTN|nr:hypothetical protein [Streptomyces bauhiniae]NEB92420.1 hypothetical protein [Streptomyces bauhiniae]
MLDLERAAEAERAKLAGLDGEEHAAQQRTWREAAAVFQQAVTAHAAAAGVDRHTLEQAVKHAVRHNG